MRSTRKLIDNGPPILENEPTFSAFFDCKTELLEFLQLLPGDQIIMSSIPPDLDSEVIMSNKRQIDNDSFITKINN